MTGSGHRLALATAAVAASLAIAAPARAATAWAVDPAHSRLSFVATQSGGEFQGRFDRFHADIVFDPQDLGGSRFHVTIETGSANTQDEDRDTALAGNDFFATGRWPTATFDSTRFVATTGGRYETRGRLTIRGISRDVNVIFSFKPAAGGHGATLAGGTTIRRLDFGVGQGEWRDTAAVGNDVRIEFELVLSPGPPAQGNHRAAGRAAPALLKPTAA